MEVPYKDIFHNVFFLQRQKVFQCQGQYLALYLFTNLVITNVGQLRLRNVTMRYHLRQTGLEKLYAVEIRRYKGSSVVGTLSARQVFRCIRLASEWPGNNQVQQRELTVAGKEKVREIRARSKNSKGRARVSCKISKAGKQQPTTNCKVSGTFAFGVEMYSALTMRRVIHRAIGPNFNSFTPFHTPH